MMNNIFHNETPAMKVFDGIVLLAVFLWNTAVLGIDWHYIAVAVGGSFSGAVILAYFRRDPRKGEQAFKTLSAAVSGIIIGSAIEEYFTLESTKFIVGVFFLSGLLSLAVLRALINLTEQSAGDILKDLLQRVFNLKLPEESERRKRRRGLGENSNNNKEQ